MEVKIAHCADIHLGMNLNKIDRISQIRRDEIKSSFFNMVDIINKNNVDLLLIAGDLFHDVDVHNLDVDEVKNAFNSLKGRVVISPGNHDPFTDNSPYSSMWPENVYIFQNNFINYFEFKDLETRVWGSAFTPSNNSGARIQVKDNGNFTNILLIHGTFPPGSDDSYNPISLSEIRESKMNYVAMGHIHKRTPILREGKTFYSYPGCLGGRSFKELGKKGFYLGTISQEICKIDFINMSKRIYCEFSVDITDLNTSTDICKNIINIIKEKYGESFQNNAYRIVLLGIIEDIFILDIRYIKNKLQEELFHVEIEDKTEIYSSNSNNLKNIFIRKANNYIKNCTNKEEREIAQKALKLGIMSFSQEVRYNED